MRESSLDVAQPPSRGFFWDQYETTTMGCYLAGRESAFLTQYLADATQLRRLLDIGCGSGRVSRLLHNAATQVVGMDISPSALSMFRRRCNGVPLVAGDAIQLPFADERYDAIVAIQCVQYFTDHHRFLAECHRILRPGGLLILQSLNRCNYKSGLKRLVGRADGGGPSGSLSCHEMLRAIARQDFDIQAVSGYNWVPFDRYSNSKWVNVTGRIERILRLDRLYPLSPWLLVTARKRGACHTTLPGSFPSP